MPSFKTNLLAGSAALLLASLFSAPAFAVDVDGGGSSLIGPYLAQALDCHVDNGSGQVNLYKSTGTNPFAACPTVDLDASPDTSNVFNYLISGSGAGIKGFLTQTPANLGVFPTGVTFSDLTYAASDSPMTTADIATYNTGSSDPGRGINSSITAPASTRGALIQIPVSVDAVTIAYNPEYVDSGVPTPFHVSWADGKVRLDKNAYCGIFTGAITNWNDSALTALNNGVSLTNSVSVPIKLVGRSDGSGTTNIFTRHLATVCGSSNATNVYHDDGQGSAQQGTANLTVAETALFFATESGSPAVADEIAATTGAVGYIGADYTSDYTAASGATTDVIVAANLINHNNTTLYTPSGANATTAFNAGASLPTGSDRADPSKWVPTTTVADPSTGYPIIGTTNLTLYQYYDQDHRDALVGQTALGDAVDGVLPWYLNNTQSDDVLSNVGLAALPSSWKSAIYSVFVDPTDPEGLGLTIQTTP